MMTETDLKYVAFDLETAALADNETYALGITCAAAVTSDGAQFTWHGAVESNGMYALRMTPEEIKALLRNLLALQKQGYQVVTWNGAAFDFRVMAAELAGDAPHVAAAQRLALEHVDPAFSMFAHKGFMCGLNAAAAGLHVAGKLAGMCGAEAVAAWQASREHQDLVLRYVIEDCAALGRVYAAAARAGGIRWITKAGRASYWPCSQIADLTVAEALNAPQPDTSWMTGEVRTRADLLGWTGCI